MREQSIGRNGDLTLLRGSGLQVFLSESICELINTDIYQQCERITVPTETRGVVSFTSNHFNSILCIPNRRQISLMNMQDPELSDGEKMVLPEYRTHTVYKTLLLPSGTKKSK